MVKKRRVEDLNREVLKSMLGFSPRRARVNSATTRKRASVLV